MWIGTVLWQTPCLDCYALDMVGLHIYVNKKINQTILPYKQKVKVFLAFDSIEREKQFQHDSK